MLKYYTFCVYRYVLLLVVACRCAAWDRVRPRVGGAATHIHMKHSRRGPDLRACAANILGAAVAAVRADVRPARGDGGGAGDMLLPAHWHR